LFSSPASPPISGGRAGGFYSCITKNIQYPFLWINHSNRGKNTLEIDLVSLVFRRCRPFRKKVSIFFEKDRYLFEKRSA
jgi:hypothetical protein